MIRVKIEVENRKYDVDVVENEEEAKKGLQGVTKLGEFEGMLFPYEEEDEVSFWMKDTLIPLDIIFIDEDGNVTRVVQAQPLDETPIVGIAKDVLELNINSGVQIGDQVFYDEEDVDVHIKKMQVIASDGSTQMELDGGERIFSRKNTKTLIRLAKRAYKMKSDSNFRSLGKKVIKYLDTQDSNDPEYVSLPDDE